MHQANRRHWNAVAEKWQQLRDRDQLWRVCHREPTYAFDGRALEMIQSFCAPLQGKRACVIGSGDNYAAFALAGLGATVTSTDISELQLKVAAQRADTLGLDITFVACDAADLAPLARDTYDLVCSTNGFLVWIAQPARVFAAVHRVLRPGGHYIFYDIHPFQRPWKNQTTLEMKKAYDDTGPFTDENGPGLTYEFAWTLSDLINPLLEVGLSLRQIAESPAQDARFWQDHSYTPGTDKSLLDWRANPRAGLPVWLTVAARKPLRTGA
jgi:SAM-dependent methyltransferase